VLAPFLSNATMFHSFHLFGTIPVSFDTLNIIVSGPVITLVNSFTAFGCRPSGPGDLFGLMPSTSFLTSDSSNFDYVNGY
jgi:hypothetical protein